MEQFETYEPINGRRFQSKGPKPTEQAGIFKTVLIVEDDEPSMNSVVAVLQANGYDILQSVDGSDVLQLAREHHPDLIVMDIQLPGILGIALTKSLKADDTLRDIPVLAVMAYAMRGDEERILEAGCDGYMAKPFSVPNFLEVVEKLIK